MSLVLDFLVAEPDVNEEPPSGELFVVDRDLAHFSYSLHERPHPELLREPPPPVEPRLPPELWTDFFGVL